MLKNAELKYVLQQTTVLLRLSISSLITDLDASEVANDGSVVDASHSIGPTYQCCALCRDGVVIICPVVLFSYCCGGRPKVFFDVIKDRLVEWYQTTVLLRLSISWFITDLDASEGANDGNDVDADHSIGPAYQSCVQMADGVVIICPAVLFSYCCGGRPKVLFDVVKDRSHRMV